MLKFDANQTIIQGLRDEASNVTIDRFVIIEATKEQPVILHGSNTLGSFVKFGLGSTVGLEVQCDDYVSLGTGSTVGRQTQLLYGVTVHQDVSIGERCIVSGDVGNWTVMEDDVTFMGRIVHRQNQAHSLDTWGSAPVPSPHIRSGAFVGENAMLLGGITIGRGAYIDMGEIVRTDVPDDHVHIGGEVLPIERFRGYISARHQK